MSKCEKGTLLGEGNAIDLEQSLNDNNARIMAINTQGNVLDQIGGSVQFGKRQDLFWIVISVILAVVLIVSTVFKRKKGRR